VFGFDLQKVPLEREGVFEDAVEQSGMTIDRQFQKLAENEESSSPIEN
jgi:hypothetical protein